MVPPGHDFIPVLEAHKIQLLGGSPAIELRLLLDRIDPVSNM